MSDDYVRKDIYDANMAEIRALMAASEARHERLNAEIRGEVKELRQKLEGDTNLIVSIYDSMNNAINWGIAIMAFLFVVIQLAITLVPYFLKLGG